MEPSTLIYGGVAIVGTLVGWRVRGMRHGSERRTLDELYMRKVRLAESDREKAILALNQGKIEMRSTQGRFQGLSEEIEALQIDLEASQARAASTAQELADTSALLADTRAQIDGFREVAETSKADSEDSVRARGLMAREVDEARRTLAERDSQIEQMQNTLMHRQAQAEELKEDIERLEAELGESRRSADELGGDLERTANESGAAQTEVARLTERLGEIDRLEGVVEDQQSLLEQKAGTIAALEERISELAPYPKKLSESEKLLAEKTREWEAMESRLNDTWDEKHKAILTAKSKEVEAIQERLAKRDAEIETREANISKLEERLKGLQPFPDRFRELEKQLSHKQKDWDDERRRLEESLGQKLESRMAAKDDEQLELMRQLEERDAGIAERQSRIEELERKVLVLQPYPDRLEETQRKLDEKQREWEELESRLNDSWDERHRAILEAKTNEVKAVQSTLTKREEDLETKHATVTDLEHRIAALLPYPDRLRSAEELLAQKERDWKEREEAVQASLETRHQTDVGERVRAIEELRAELAEVEERARSKEADLARMEGRLAELSLFPDRLERKEAELAEKEREWEKRQKELEEAWENRSREGLGEARRREETLESKLQRAEKKLEALMAQLETQRKKDEEHKTELVERKTHLSNLSSSHKSMQLKMDRLLKTAEEQKASLAKRDERLKELQVELRDRGKEVKALEAQLKRAEAATAKAVKAAEAEAKRASATKTVTPPKPKNASGTPKKKTTSRASTATKDDLKLLLGVGPALEKKLNRLGYRSYSQIAAMDKDAIERVADSLGTTPQKIRKDRWITTAKREHRAKYGAAL